MIALLIVAAFAGHSPDPSRREPTEIVDLCARAYQSTVGETEASAMQERWVGRMEIEIEKARLDGDLAQFTRLVCSAYFSGVVRGLEHSLEIMEAGEK